MENKQNKTKKKKKKKKPHIAACSSQSGTVPPPLLPSRSLSYARDPLHVCFQNLQLEPQFIDFHWHHLL
jgi:hypothetical protein